MAKSVTSAWEPAIVVRQERHRPQPRSPGSSWSHSRAAARARAAVERPEPGGPVNSQAWAGALWAAARRSWATAASWPTS
ncbi:Uncharacterised protein [Mycobacteroides abscessus subsp. abscessus]|nr:Uncharacterised protein [Mycobacteroides abscessus subsp. abscessus]